MGKLLLANQDKCSGCNRCSYVCSAKKTGEFAPSKSRIQVNNFPHRGFAAPSICFQCPNAACQKACPMDAFSRNSAEALVVDEEKCNGCGLCITACPYGMIELNEKEIACKCDYCDGDPACVKECYPNALLYQEAGPELVKLKAAQMKQRSSCGTPAEKREKLGQALLSAARDELGSG